MAIGEAAAAARDVRMRWRLTSGWYVAMIVKLCEKCAQSEIQTSHKYRPCLCQTGAKYCVTFDLGSADRGRFFVHVIMRFRARYRRRFLKYTALAPSIHVHDGSDVFAPHAVVAGRRIHPARIPEYENIWFAQAKFRGPVFFSHVDRNRAPWTGPWTGIFSRVDAVGRK